MSLQVLEQETQIEMNRLQEELLAAVSTDICPFSPPPPLYLFVGVIRFWKFKIDITVWDQLHKKRVNI